MAGEAVFTKKRRLNVVDIILMLIIVLAICALAYILIGNKLTTESNYETVYTIVVPIVKNEIAQEAQLLKPGAVITDSVRGYNIGKLVSVSLEPATINVANQMTGVVTEELYPEHSKITLTVKSECDKSDKGYSINGYEIYVGVQVHFRTEHLVNYGNCTSLKLTEKTRTTTAAQEG
ncbi:MAG: DUF4330 family protein [Eubacteriales bacterium]